MFYKILLSLLSFGTHVGMKNNEIFATNHIFGNFQQTIK